jgi:hypothetical protein
MPRHHSLTNGAARWGTAPDELTRVRAFVAALALGAAPISAAAAPLEPPVAVVPPPTDADAPPPDDGADDVPF